MGLAHNINEGHRTQDIQISQDVTFETMLLASNTLEGLKMSGFYKPSPVQLHGIPLGKCGFDLLLEAKSGTGKTAVFSVIALEKLELSKGLQVVILAPTREIASQISDVIKQLGFHYKGLVVEVVMGGLPVAEDVMKFKKNVHIVVGSPGRLKHLIQDNHINLSFVRLLVLDEADKLMEKSFLPDINYIFSMLPKEKQVIMSSATYPEMIKTFIEKYVKCAQHVCPDSNCILLGVEQKITVVKYHSNIVKQTQHRFEELLKILSKKQFKQCLIFCNYQARVHELYKLLVRGKWPVEQLCGQQDQSDRLDALKTLQEYKCRILISTDLAARGIDASNVDLVINFEPPFEWQTYLHRIGRAGRYGSYGMAVTILSEKKEEQRFKSMLETINLDSLKLPHFWTNQITAASNQDASQHCTAAINNLLSNGYDEIHYKEFWDNLVNNSDTAHGIDDFAVLCKSFEESQHSKIESFTDLINSYKIGTNNDRTLYNDIIYQNMAMQSAIIKKIFQSTKKIENNNNTYLENNHINKENIVPASAANSISIASINHNFLNNKLLCKKDIEQFDEGDDIAGDLSSALQDLGLPSSFANPKKCQFGKGKPVKVKNDEFQNTVRKSYKDNYKQCDQNKNKKNICKDTKRYPRIQDTLLKRQEKISNNNDEVRNTNNPRLSSYNVEYNVWYKQLKQRVKYIELNLYIQEMTRLQSYQ